MRAKLYKLAGWERLTGKRPNHRVTSGFTLIEVLFVVLIIMILMVLLLVAVQAAMRASRRAACQKNMTEIGRSFRQFFNQYDGLSAGTIPDTMTSTGGIWETATGDPAIPINNGGVIGMQGWDGYMGYALQQFDDEGRRQWYCPETASPYIGNARALGRQVPVPKFRSNNYRVDTGMALNLGTVYITQIQNPNKCILAYDAGIGLTGEGGMAPTIVNNSTDFDDGGPLQQGTPGHALGDPPTNWNDIPHGYLWYSVGTPGPFLEGPHQRNHNVLRADGSVDSLREPNDPRNPGMDAEIVTNPMDMSQLTRQYTRFPKLSSSF